PPICEIMSVICMTCSFVDLRERTGRKEGRRRRASYITGRRQHPAEDGARKPSQASRRTELSRCFRAYAHLGSVREVKLPRWCAALQVKEAARHLSAENRARACLRRESGACRTARPRASRALDTGPDRGSRR